MTRKKKTFWTASSGRITILSHAAVSCAVKVHTLGGGSALANKVDAGMVLVLLPTLRPGSI